MHILFFTSSFPRDRKDISSVFVKRLAEEIAADPSFQISVLAPQVADMPFDKQFGLIRVHRFRYWFPRRSQLLTTGSIRDQIIRYPRLVMQVPFFLVAELWALVKLLRREPVDIIHAHWLFPQGFITALYKRFIRPSVRIVCTVHGSDVNVLRGTFFRAIHRWAIAMIDAVVVVSPSLAENPLFSGQKHPNIISMGFDPVRAPQEAVEIVRDMYDRGPLLLFVARLVPAKNLDTVIDAMPHVWKKMPGASLVIIGDGSFREHYAEQAARSDRPEQIHFLGNLPKNKLAVYYCAADVLVAASNAEGFGLIFLEALSAGLPIVTTSVGIIPTIASEAVFVFAKEDGPETIARVIEQALDRKQGMSREELEVLTRTYGWRTVADQYKDEYKNVL